MTHLQELTGALDRRLADADERLARIYPGDRGVRQPVHTVYVPADAFHAGLVAEWGRRALDALDTHAPTALELAEGLGISPRTAAAVYGPVRDKLGAEPVEDLRIDFEDGYGSRPDDEEDAAATTAAQSLREALDTGVAPPYVGIRFKSLERDTRARGVRTLDLFVGELARSSELPPGFVVTLPKVTSVDQVEAMVLVCEQLEVAYALTTGSLRFEIQVETPQSVLGPDGTALVAPMVHASGGRCTGLHYGTYDYSASCGIAGAYQSMEHPAADYAKAVMQAAAAGTGVHLSDGSTNVLPAGDHAAVLAGWRLHSRLVRRSLGRGYYQGWDLHPAQLPSRFAATFAFYAEGLPQAVERLRAYVQHTASGFMDEPATAAALAGFVLRAVECGAVSEQTVREQTTLARSRLDRLARRPGVSTAADPAAPASAQVNAAPESELRHFLTACCDVPAWVDAVVAGRPYAGNEALFTAADSAARGFTAGDVDRALAAHPRIGEKPAGASPQARWSRAEQSTVSTDVSSATLMAEVNRRYEARFGRVFLICASELSAEQVLAAAQDRMTSSDATEAAVVAEELRKIALVRLRKGMRT